jgi:hypothetical protein
MVLNERRDAENGIRALLRADSDDGGHQFQFDPGHHSNVMAAI